MGVLSSGSADPLDRGGCWGWEGDAFFVHHLIQILVKYHKTNKYAYQYRAIVIFLTLRHAGMITGINVHDRMDLKEYECIIEMKDKTMTYTVWNVRLCQSGAL